MPIYEYACRQCGHQFETLVRSGSQPECPNCRSRELDKQLSVIATPVVSSGATAAAPAPCGSCGHPDGPGACAFG